MGRKSIAARAARESARRRAMKMSMNDIYKSFTAKYPHCAGLMAECPPVIDDPKNPPEKCRICPNFMESRYHKGSDAAAERIKEIHNLFASMRKTHAEIEKVEEKIAQDVNKDNENIEN